MATEDQNSSTLTLVTNHVLIFIFYIYLKVTIDQSYKILYSQKIFILNTLQILCVRYFYYKPSIIYQAIISTRTQIRVCSFCEESFILFFFSHNVWGIWNIQFWIWNYLRGIVSENPEVYNVKIILHWVYCLVCFTQIEVQVYFLSKTIMYHKLE